MNFDPSQSATRKPYTPAPQGMHYARCISIVDMGTQDGKFGAKRKMNVTWELIGSVMPKENATDLDRPFTISKEYTMSFDKKATWRKDVGSWLARPIGDGEIVSSKELLGKECMLNVIHKMKQDQSGVRADIAAVAPAMAGAQVPPAKNPVYEFEIGSPNQFQVFPQIHAWMRDRIVLSPEFQGECQRSGQSAAQLNEGIKAAWRAQNQQNNQQGGQQQYQQQGQPAMQPNQQWMQQGQQQQPWQGQQQAYQQPAQQYQQGPPPGYSQPAQYPPQNQPYHQPTQPAQTGFGQQQPAQTGFGQYQQPSQHPQQNQQRNMNPQQPAPAFGQQPIYTGNQNDVHPLD